MKSMKIHYSLYPDTNQTYTRDSEKERVVREQRIEIQRDIYITTRRRLNIDDSQAKFIPDDLKNKVKETILKRRNTRKETYEEN